MLMMLTWKTFWNRKMHSYFFGIHRWYNSKYFKSLSLPL